MSNVKPIPRRGADSFLSRKCQIMCSTLRRNGPGRGSAGANEVTRRAPQILRLRQSGLLPQPARPFPQNLPPLNLNRDRNWHSKGAVLPPQSPKGSPSKAVVKLNLLRIHRAVCAVHMNRPLLVERYGIHETVAALRRKDGASSTARSTARSSRVSRLHLNPPLEA